MVDHVFFFLCFFRLAPVYILLLQALLSLKDWRVFICWMTIQWSKSLICYFLVTLSLDAKHGHFVISDAFNRCLVVVVLERKHVFLHRLKKKKNVLALCFLCFYMIVHSSRGRWCCENCGYGWGVWLLNLRGRMNCGGAIGCFKNVLFVTFVVLSGL